MTSAAFTAASPGRLGALASPVIEVIDLPESEASFTPATNTGPRQRPDGAMQRREALAARLKSLQRQARNREASICSAELRRVTTEILRRTT